MHFEGEQFPKVHLFSCEGLLIHKGFSLPFWLSQARPKAVSKVRGSLSSPACLGPQRKEHTAGLPGEKPVLTPVETV